MNCNFNIYFGSQCQLKNDPDTPHPPKLLLTPGCSCMSQLNRKKISNQFKMSNIECFLNYPVD